MRSAPDWWRRAVRALRTAELLSGHDPDACVSRAYYAAFYAVTALMALEERSFSSHHALRIAVHRDLVRAGRWTSAEGEAFDWLSAVRHTGDYGGAASVDTDDARMAFSKARSILDAALRASHGQLPEIE